MRRVAFAAACRMVGTSLTGTSTVIAVAVAAAALFVAGTVQAQTIRTWDGGASTNVLTTGSNWSGDAVPASTGTTAATRQDALFDGSVAGTLNLTFSSAFGGSNGVGLVLSSGQTNAVNITNTNATLQNFRVVTSTSPTVGGIQIASGAGALTIGATGTANPVYLVLGAGSGSFDYYFNNSSANAATIEENVTIIRGGSQTAAALIFDGTGSWNVRGKLDLLGATATSGSLNVNGGANVTLSGDNIAFKGAININQGTLRIGNGSTTGRVSALSAITGSTGATLAFNRTDTYGNSFANTISGGLALTLSSGTLTLSGTNTYSGTTTISGTDTRLLVASADALGGTAAGTRVVGAGTTNGMGLQVESGVTVTGEALELDGATGRATLFLNQNSAWAGDITFANGTNYNAIQLSGTGIQINGTINAPGTYSGFGFGVGLRGAGTATVSGPITAGSNTVEFGRDGGTWILTNSANTMGSAVIWASGTMQIGGAGQLNNGSYGGTIVFNASTSRFDYGSSADQILSGVISGSGSVTQSGAGTLTLSGTNTYTGTTTVSGGSLYINGSLATGAVTVQAGGRLGGSGSIGGAVTINSGGVLAPGTSIESLTTGTQSFLNGSTYEYEIDSAAALSLAADFTKALGDLSLAGTVGLSIIDLAGSPTAFNQGTTFSLINYTGSWNNGLFTVGGSQIADGGTFTVGLNTWQLNYAATSGGSNFPADHTSGSFVNIVVVPEPRALALAAIGIACGAAALRRRRQP